MRAAAAVVAFFGVGLLGGDALADSLPVPTVPSVTVPAPPPLPVAVPLPAVPQLPAPAVPQLPAPAVPAPVQKAAASTEAAAATGAAASTTSGSLQVPAALGSSFSSSGGSASPSYSSGSSSASSSGSSRSAASTRPKVKHLHSSRPWIATAGDKRRRVTTLTFSLTRPTTVIFTVRQLSPGCGTIGRFVVRGHAGLNRVRFAGRVGKEQLGAGTYRITARTRSGRSVQRVIVVIVDGSAPSRSELLALRASNACASGTSGIASTAANGSTGASNTGGISGDVETTSSPDEQPYATALRSSNPHSAAVLASAVEKTARAIKPGLVALLAAAIVLLGLASLPRVALVEPRVGDTLARHRTEIAGLGAVALLAVVIAFLVG